MKLTGLKAHIALRADDRHTGVRQGECHHPVRESQALVGTAIADIDTPKRDLNANPAAFHLQTLQEGAEIALVHSGAAVERYPDHPSLFPPGSGV